MPRTPDVGRKHWNCPCCGEGYPSVQAGAQKRWDSLVAERDRLRADYWRLHQAANRIADGTATDDDYALLAPVARGAQEEER